MECNISGNLDVNCDDLRLVGGVNKKAYLFNLGDLASTGEYNTDSTGYITQINFQAYKGLYTFESRKNAHSGGYTPQIQTPGGNKFFQHDVILKVFPDTPGEDQTLENTLVANLGIILESNNKEFFLYGKENGMDQTEGSQNTGQEFASDVGYSMTFAGSEQNLPKRILVQSTGDAEVDYQATKNYLQSLVDQVV